MGKRESFKVAAGLAVFLLLTGCLKTPDLEYVVNKESQGNYVYEENSDFGSLKEQLGIPEHVTESFSSEDGMVTGKINADVAVPTEGVVPVYSVVPVEWSEEQLKFYCESIYDGEFYRYPYYDRRYDGYILTKESIEAEIIDIQKKLDTCIVADENTIIDDKGSYVDENGNIISNVIPEIAYETLQNRIGELLKKREYVPSEAELREEMDQIPLYALEPYTVKVKNIIQNNDNMGSVDYNYNAAEYLGERNGNKVHMNFAQDEQTSILHIWLDDNVELKCGYSYQEISFYEKKSVTANDSINNQCSYTAEEAKELCRDFLQGLGMTDLDVCVVQHINLNAAGKQLGYRGYKIFCYRSYGEIGDMLYHGYDEEDGDDTLDFYLSSYVDYDAETESIRHIAGSDREIAVFTVLDEGIVEAGIMNPRKNQACLAENTKLLDFDTVLQQGIAQMSVQYAPAGERQGRKGLTINAIELNYACMKNPNAEKEYTMIPVWDFKSGWSGQTYITINAVDGTVFNRKTGY